ncbi:MAG: tRNA lysidine(34) synthetase TilS [Flavobacteriales bacterium]|nr:tRNA lysidine(34) synthetase TilS [Flavobacteriales bacterium]
MNNFARHIAALDDSDRLLIAVSGGKDSMALLHLLSQQTIHVEVAHANFGLRGEESDGDEEFVKRSCKSLGVTCHIKRFDLQRDFPELGTQEAARNARYQWFRELLTERELTYITTAHHEGDQVESILQHFIRGAGPEGMVGMQALEGDLFRPLIHTPRASLLEYIDEQQIKFREDSTNATPHYTRNRVRHQLLPLLREFNPNFDETISRQSDLFLEGTQAIETCVDMDLKRWWNASEKSLNLDAISESLTPKHLILHLLSIHGFRPTHVEEVLKLADSQPGAKVEFDEKSIYRERDALVFRSDTTVQDQWVIQRLEDFDQSPLEAEIFNPAEVDLNQPHQAVFDADLLSYPLVLRPWKAGDRFQPLGMKGSQKLSDFLVQQKVAPGSKSGVLVLTSNDLICWVVPHRIDEKFKVRADTKKVLRIRALETL